jgi:hypothetical protein
MPRVDSGGGAVVRVPGAYGALLERERELTDAGDPRRVASAGGGFMRRPTVLFEALSRGEAVTVPVWKLGGRTAPDDRLRRLARNDRTITGWLVSVDDSVTPVREPS